MMSDFEVHERGTAQELRLLRELATILSENHEHMQYMNCYPRPVRQKFAEVMQFYKEQQLAGYI
jgi:hypothetical protein